MNPVISRLLLSFFLGGCLSAAGAEKAPPATVVSFDLLRQTTHAPNQPPHFAKALSALEGKRVRISGHVCPYDQHMIRLMKFLVTSEQNPGCYFCNPPDETDMFFVRLPAGGLPMVWKTETVTVEGVLHLMGDRKDDKEAAQFLATIDDAVVVARK